MISGPINIVGNHVESQGTYVTRIKNTNRTPTNGAAAFTTWAKLIPVMPEVTNKFNPTGGVIIPISILTTIMIPKWIGSIPSSIAIGNTTGATINKRPDGSIN